MRRRCALAAVCVLVWLAPASAQPREPRVELSAGGLFAGGYDLTSSSADIVRNEPGGGAYPVFDTDTRAESAPAFEARAGWRFAPRFTLEGGVLVGRPRLSSRLSGDVEGAPDATISEDVSQYIIDGAILATLGSLNGGRVVPFVRLGAGYLRELHEDNMLVETGQAYHAGGGLTAWLGANQRIGLRVDGRVYFLQGGIDLGKSSRTMAAGGGALVFAF
jgi:hypothetical protein